MPPPAAEALLAALTQQAIASWENDGYVRHATVRTVWWSPRALPTGVGLFGRFSFQHYVIGGRT